jgi:hypothetical protein
MATVPDTGHPLFEAMDAETVRDALHRLGGGLLTELRGSLDGALHGSNDAAREYVCHYRLLTEALLSEGRRARPDLITDVGDGRLTIADAQGHPVRAWLGVLENGSVDAPFLPWTARYELGDAVALELTSRMRAFMGCRALMPPAEPGRPPVDDLAAERFQRHVRAHLNDPGGENPLERLMRVFALSKSELGRLFGVSRQAVDGWLAYGVPADRQEKLATLLALADLLERKLKADRIPGIARRPAEAYGGQTMLELIAADRQSELLELARESFAWSQAA